MKSIAVFVAGVSVSDSEVDNFGNIPGIFGSSNVISKDGSMSFLVEN